MQDRSRKGSKFENAWLTEPWFNAFVMEQWHKDENDNIVDILENYGENMIKWSKENYHKIRKEIESLCKKIERLQQHVGEGNINYFLALKIRMNSLLIKDDMFWKQRAKAHWHKEGDPNTQFFHIIETARKKVNTILSLTNENGEVSTSNEGMCRTVHDYFTDLFQKKPSSQDMVLHAIGTYISDEDNIMLMTPFVF